MFISLATLLLASTTMSYEINNSYLNTQKTILSQIITTSGVSLTQQTGAMFTCPFEFENDDDLDFYLNVNGERLKFFNVHYYTSSASTYIHFSNYLQSNLYFNIVALDMDDTIEFFNDDVISTFVAPFSYNIDNIGDFVSTDTLFFNFTFSCYDESAYELITSPDYQSGYNQGYEYGYNQGYNEGSSTAFQEGVAQGESTGYNNGYDVGYDLGYQNGRRDALNERPLELNFLNMLGAIADTPIYIIRNLFSFEFFGISALAVFMTLLTACIVLYFIRKIL